jgi:hypothetical protein
MSTALGHYVSDTFQWSVLDITVEAESTNIVLVNPPAVSSFAQPRREESHQCEEVEGFDAQPLPHGMGTAVCEAASIDASPSSAQPQLCNLGDRLASLASTPCPARANICAERPPENKCIDHGSRRSEDDMSEINTALVVSPPAFFAHRSGSDCNVAEQLFSLSKAANLQGLNAGLPLMGAPQAS